MHPAPRLLSLLALLPTLLAAGCRKAEPPPATAPTPPSAPAGTSPAPLAPDFAKITGRWAREDGEYFLVFKPPRPDGGVEAGYFNPSPIHVSKAEVRPAGGVLNVFVELQDVNYPGCTYTLRYDAAQDALRGVYYQALHQAEYDVTFRRAP